jgi:hypothetical protein
MEKILSDIYYDAKTGFIGSQKLYTRAKAVQTALASQGKAVDSPIKKKQVMEWLKKQEVNQIHTPQPIKRSQYKTILGPEGAYQADLMFLPKYRQQNKGFTIILTMIEINTRKAYAEPLKTKTGKEVGEAMRKIIKRLSTPIVKLETDNGLEFLNPVIKKIIDNKILHQTFDEGNHRALARIERFHGTLKNMLSKYMTAKNSTRWIDHLSDFMDNYNSSVHSSLSQVIGEPVTPEDITPELERVIINEATQHNQSQVSSIKVGDMVRKRIGKHAFKRADEPSFTKKVYEVMGRVGNQFDIGLKHPVSSLDLQVVELPAREQNESIGSAVDIAGKKHKDNKKISREGLNKANIIAKGRLRAT